MNYRLERVQRSRSIRRWFDMYRQGDREGHCETSHGVILVVEDDAFLREVTADYLAEVGLPVLKAETADDAVAMLKDHDEIGAVFSDVQMPGELDGFGLALWISRERPEVKVLLTSGNLDPASAGKLTLISKPYRMGDVARRLRAMVC